MQEIHCIGDPSTAVKFHILENFLQAWIPSCSTYNESLLYLDFFAGSTEYLYDDIKIDGSSIRAISAFTDFFGNLSNMWDQRKAIKRFNMWFVEKNEKKYDKLITNTQRHLLEKFQQYDIEYQIVVKEEINENIIDQFYEIKKDGFKIQLNIRYELNDFQNVKFDSFAMECNIKFILIDPTNKELVKSDFLDMLCKYDVLMNIDDEDYEINNKEEFFSLIKTESIENEIFEINSDLEIETTDDMLKLGNGFNNELNIDYFNQRKFKIRKFEKCMILNFKMKDKQDKFKNELKFLTNSKLSFKHMKEAMFIYDQLINNKPEFQFSELAFHNLVGETKYAEKSSLSKKIYDKKCYLQNSAKIVFNHFKNQSENKISVDQVERFVSYETPFVFRKETINYCGELGFIKYYMKKRDTEDLSYLFSSKANTFNNADIKFFDSKYDQETITEKVILQLKVWFPQEIDLKLFERALKHTALNYTLNLRYRPNITKFKKYLVENSLAIINNANREIKLF